MEQTLSANELKRFRSLLTARISELESATRKCDDIAVETNPDEMDDIQRAIQLIAGSPTRRKESAITSFKRLGPKRLSISPSERATDQRR
jgi:hypothetical protein